ncbi:DEAD/DEAH box helicase [Tomitella fengzijianii]|uniref:DEAD/DEAH box helicase n=1 Tax=Tomitella fengzijianii TaxID=2597660 RepID=UPI001E3CCB35|nr:DEAD/DEAH box helicase [Tomitella fengzijianii]
MSAVLQGIELRAWQRDALSMWEEAGRRAVIEAVTGTGKTTLGLAAAADAVGRGLDVLVVVPSVDLLEQWHAAFRTALPGVPVGRRGAGYHDAFPQVHVLVTIVNSAITPSFRRPTGATLLIADEVHRYGAGGFAAVLDDDYSERLGLTATFERPDGGVELHLQPYFENVIAGCDYLRGRQDGILAPVKVLLVSVDFLPHEQAEYAEWDEMARAERHRLIEKFGCRAEPFGSFMQDVQEFSDGGGEDATWSARKYLNAFSRRKAVLANSEGKLDALEQIGAVLAAAGRTIVFSETKESAYAAAGVLTNANVNAAPYTSDLKRRERADLLESFKTGGLSTLVAPRVLDEGVDVPEADVGIILAGSKSKRQMIQRMGRIIRPKADGRHASFVVMYMRGSSEDPDGGAHEVFLSELMAIAEDIVSCTAEEAGPRLAEWLRLEAKPEVGAREVDGTRGRTSPSGAGFGGESSAPGPREDTGEAGEAATDFDAVFARAAARGDAATADSVLACMSVLEPLQASILSLRFGVGGKPALSAMDVAKRLRVGEIDVRWHESSALVRLGWPDTAPVLAALSGSGV